MAVQNSLTKQNKQKFSAVIQQDAYKKSNK